MDNPSRILQSLDAHMDHSVRLVLYGRAALCLGFDNPPAEAGITKDVDAIISLQQAGELESDSGFWDAIEATNTELAAEGLYITHLFSEAEVFLRSSWAEHLVPVTRPSLRWVRQFRPATIDLVLTKMMRGADPQDMADAEFMIQHDRITKQQLFQAFSEMRPVELVELRDAFNLAKPLIVKAAETIDTQ